MNRLRVIAFLIAMIMLFSCCGCASVGQVVDRILADTLKPLQDPEETLSVQPTEETQPVTEPDIPETTEATESTETEPVVETGPVGMGITSGDYVNVRTGPGTQYDILKNIRKNTRLEILEIQDNWCKTSEGWIYLDYVYIDGTYGSEPSMMGSINGTDVNIRSGPGMDYEIIGSTNTGDRYEFFYQTTIGGRKWGCTSLGWICMDYVKLDGTPAPDNPGPTVPKQ